MTDTVPKIPDIPEPVLPPTSVVLDSMKVAWQVAEDGLLEGGTRGERLSFRELDSRHDGDVTVVYTPGSAAPAAPVPPAPAVYVVLDHELALVDRIAHPNADAAMEAVERGVGSEVTWKVRQDGERRGYTDLDEYRIVELPLAGTEGGA